MILKRKRLSKAASRLSESIRNNSFHKRYLAVVNGKFQNKVGSYENYLFKNEALNKSMVVSKDKNGAKLAKLSYEVIEEKTIDGQIQTDRKSTRLNSSH